MILKALEKFMQCNHYAKNKHLGALYFGTGLSSFSKPSIGFGIEFLSYVLAAIGIKRKLGLKKVYHEISTIGYNISEEIKNLIVTRESKLVNNMINFLHISEEYELLFSHEYHANNDFETILRNVEQKLEKLNIYDNKGILNYTCLQCTGMEYLRQHYDVNFKLGWLTDSIVNIDEISDAFAKELTLVGRLNEGYFDSMYRYIFPNSNYNFIYTHAAYDLLNGNRAAPYNVSQGQCRIVLNGIPIDEQLKKATNSKLLNKMLNMYQQEIIEPFEEMFFKIPIENINNQNVVIEKLEYIRKNICKNVY